MGWSARAGLGGAGDQCSCGRDRWPWNGLKQGPGPQAGVRGEAMRGAGLERISKVCYCPSIMTVSVFAQVHLLEKIIKLTETENAARIFAPWRERGQWLLESTCHLASPIDLPQDGHPCSTSAFWGFHSSFFCYSEITEVPLKLPLQCSMHFLPHTYTLLMQANAEC